MPIGVKGQYWAMFEIGGIKDFLKEEQLLCFKIIEDTGNIIPIFQLDICIWDELVLKYINEGKNLIISMGKTIDKMTSATFKITKSVPTPEGEHKIRVHMVGIFAEMSYLTDKKVLITDKITSVAAIQQTILKHKGFTFSTNVTSADAMHWIQPNITDKKFVSGIWTHSYIPDSFPAIGTTTTGEFRYRDIKKLAKDEGEKPKFIFKAVKVEDKKDNEIIYDIPYDYSNNSTLNNMLYAYGKEKLVANLEAGDFTLLTQNPITPTLAMSNDANTDKDVSPRYDEHSNQSVDNVHAQFWKAKIQNLVNLFTFSTIKLKVFFAMDYQEIHVLDLVYFKEEELQSQRKYSSETITGLYVITKVCRVIENRTFKTYVEMCRETPNSIQVRNLFQEAWNIVKGAFA